MSSSSQKPQENKEVEPPLPHSRFSSVLQSDFSVLLHSLIHLLNFLFTAPSSLSKHHTLRPLKGDGNLNAGPKKVLMGISLAHVTLVYKIILWRVL